MSDSKREQQDGLYGKPEPMDRHNLTGALIQAKPFIAEEPASKAVKSLKDKLFAGKNKEKDSKSTDKSKGKSTGNIGFGELPTPPFTTPPMISSTSFKKEKQTLLYLSIETVARAENTLIEPLKSTVYKLYPDRAYEKTCIEHSKENEHIEDIEGNTTKTCKTHLETCTKTTGKMDADTYLKIEHIAFNYQDEIKAISKQSRQLKFGEAWKVADTTNQPEQLGLSIDIHMASDSKVTNKAKATAIVNKLSDINLVEQLVGLLESATIIDPSDKSDDWIDFLRASMENSTQSELNRVGEAGNTGEYLGGTSSNGFEDPYGTIRLSGLIK